LVAGLGNPGAEYERTRHNVGFVILDLLARHLGAQWERSSKWEAVWAKARPHVSIDPNAAAPAGRGEGTLPILLVKPWSFMNNSGAPLAAIGDFYKIAPQEMLVVLDDHALPLGRLRLRLNGSSAGHNGLESLFVRLGTDQIPRLRVGIGSAPAGASIDFVLSGFLEEEQPIISAAVTRAVDAIKWAIDKGIVSAMNTFNPESVRAKQTPET
jgi:PTH1 family peptidyl-tRNA hydrolase